MVADVVLSFGATQKSMASCAQAFDMASDDMANDYTV